MRPNCTGSGVLGSVHMTARLMKVLPGGRIPRYASNCRNFFRLINVGNNIRRAALDCVVHSRDSRVFGGHGRLLRAYIQRLGGGCNSNVIALRLGSRCTGVHRIVRPIVCIVSVTYRTVHRISMRPGVGPVHNKASNTRLSFGKLPYPGVFTNKIGFRDHCRFIPIRSVRGTVVAVIGVTRVMNGNWIFLVGV